eukprot:Hpha_TRINITY_DN35772_c0_g1::TRINITY_DN35772_c0_g1_i1::g.139885::m.139885
MARKSSSLLRYLSSDPTVGWVALLLGVAAIYLYIRDRRRRHVPRGARGPGGGFVNAATPTPPQPETFDYTGRSVLLHLEAVRAGCADPQFRLDVAQVETLHHLAGVSKLYTMLQVAGDEEEAVARAELERVGVLKQNALAPHRALFANTAVGLNAFGRQLRPYLVIASSREVVDYLAHHLPFVGFVTTDPGPGKPLPENVAVADTCSEVLKKLKLSAI